MRRAQITIVEIPLLILLFTTVFMTINTYYQSDESLNYDYTIDTFSNSIIQDDQIRYQILDENFSSSTLTSNYSRLINLTDKVFNNYEYILEYNNTIKYITTCNATKYKLTTTKFLYTYNTTTNQFTKLTFGVCD